MIDAEDEERIQKLAKEIADELRRALTVHPKPFNSAHEGYAVLLEEVDELKNEVWKRKPSREAMRAEAIQVAAMGLRFVHDVTDTAVERHPASVLRQHARQTGTDIHSELAKRVFFHGGDIPALRQIAKVANVYEPRTPQEYVETVRSVLQTDFQDDVAAEVLQAQAKWAYELEGCEGPPLPRLTGT